jgi:hypothetical protein
MQKALEAGMAEGQQAIELAITKSAADLFGTREFMKNNYLNRATGAQAGIYGNSKHEAFYFAFYKDASGGDLDGAKRQLGGWRPEITTAPHRPTIRTR